MENSETTGKMKRRPAEHPERDPLPVPAGLVLHESLLSRFVRFDALLDMVRQDEHTGYLRLVSDDLNGIFLVLGGEVVASLYADDTQRLEGENAYRSISDAINAGKGILDLVALSPALVKGLRGLAFGEALYSDLVSSWIRGPELLSYLAHRQHTGAIVIAAGSTVGVVILAEGLPLGGYTSVSKDLVDIEEVMALLEDPQALLEVRDSLRLRPVEAPATEAETMLLPPVSMPELLVESEEPSTQPLATSEEKMAPISSWEQPTSWDTPWQGPIASEAPPELYSPEVLAPVEPDPEPDPVPVSATLVLDHMPVDELSPDLKLPWDDLIIELQSMAEESLGNRSRKVKIILNDCDHNRVGVSKAITDIASMQILFVEPDHLAHLAKQMRERLQNFR